MWCDATAFEAALDAGNPGEALALYRGDLLEGFFISEAPEFERWLDGERERLRRRASDGAWELAEVKAADGEAFEAARWARRAADLLPADEAAARRLMSFLHALGDRAAAIQVYETFSTRLRKEYELEPSAETQGLAARVRQEEHPAPALRSVAKRPAIPEEAAVAVPRSFPVGRVVIAAAVVTALTVGAWAWLARPDAAPRPLVRFTLEFPPHQQLASAIGGPKIVLSPDGSHLVYLARGPQGNQLFLRSMDRVEAVPIPHTLGASMPFLSPDGEWLGFVIGNTIRKVPLRGGAAITVCTITTNVPGASWGPNDVIVFATPAGLWQVPAAGGDARLFAAADTARGEVYRWPEILPSGHAAVFTRADAAGFQLATVSLETGAVVPLGIEGAQPHLLRPGYLLFTRSDGALLAAAFDPQVLRITGSAFPVTEKILTGIGGLASLSVSRAGAFAYVPEPSRDRTLAIVDRSGDAEAVAPSPRGFAAARFSPDGRRIATAVAPAGGESPDIWVLDLNANTFRRVTFDSGSLAPIWSADGRRIAFMSKPGGRQYGWTVRWTPADGSDSAETLLAPALGQVPVAFTPDGRALVFQRRHPATGLDVWILPLHGERTPRPYLGGPSDEHSAALSPDGRWLAYVSNESGQEEVNVRPFTDRGSSVQISSGGGREPRWAPTGRELFYRSERGLVAVAVNPSPSFRVGRRSVLFDDKPYLAHAGGAAYDVHPDGRRFLMIRLGAETPQVVVVLNWLDQVRAADVTAGSAGRARH